MVVFCKKIFLYSDPKAFKRQSSNPGGIKEFPFISWNYPCYPNMKSKIVAPEMYSENVEAHF